MRNIRDEIIGPSTLTDVYSSFPTNSVRYLKSSTLGIYGYKNVPIGPVDTTHYSLDGKVNELTPLHNTSMADIASNRGQIRISDY